MPRHARLPAEDAQSLDGVTRRNGKAAIKIAVPQFARIANFDDLDPLVAEDDVEVDIVPPGRALPGDADLVILPGSKSTIRRSGRSFAAKAGTSTSRPICAAADSCSASVRGYQMLGHALADPEGIEGPAGSVAGLGLLDLSTEMTGDKTLTAVSGRHMASGRAIARL